ncbi:MAG: alpha-L-rhamnosidase C-terminal domain-containing protein, partial [Planctomycetia bacterium]|nr:alpha-L-rhamnosidase C-terminal domain-containing protein [Planctomycetia bacterium]
EAFHRRFYDAKRGCYSVGRLGSDAFGLALGAASPEEERRVLDNLLSNIEKNGGHLDTGIFGTPTMLDVLADHGHADVAYRMLTKTTYPSYGYMVVRGATTIWENWAEAVGSHCHPMYGSVSAWFYRHLAGIGVSPEGPGFKKFVIRPRVVGDLTSVSASLATVRGPVAVEWRHRGDEFDICVTIPAGSSAAIYIPTLGSADPVVSEGGKPLWADGAPGAPRGRVGCGPGG